MKTSFRAVCLLLVLLFVPFAACAQTNGTYSDPYSQESTYRRLVDGWRQSLENTYADIAFFGDSITYGGKWAEYFPFESVVNLGVVGDITYGLTMRVPLLEMLQPEKCFVMIGINDLIYRSSVEDVIGYYEKLVLGLVKLNEECLTSVYIQSVLPVNEAIFAYDVNNSDVALLNQRISQLAEAHGMVYIDVYTGMADENDMLKEAYTYDGLHLNELGYEKWTEILMPYIEE